jgi:hypothetical protein
VINVCCDVSPLTKAAFNPSAAPLLPSKPAIACTSWLMLGSSVGPAAKIAGVSPNSDSLTSPFGQGAGVP